MINYREEEILRSYKGRCICERKEGGLGYCGSCDISVHREQLADPNSWVHSSVARWIEEECLTVDLTHTDPGEIKTAEALKYRQRARAAEEALEESETQKAEMFGFLGHYFEAHETRSRASTWVHTGCEKLLKELTK